MEAEPRRVETPEPARERRPPPPNIPAVSRQRVRRKDGQPDAGGPSAPR
ncbi:MAG: hypothetical protein IT378_24235 [Sandaracinaceae bacterium]|nr:hypothetical protein [Sandaracinaceae bacterium]